jgi:hypothetical protein
MAIAQVEHPDCSLYVLTNKDGEPIAKCTGWMSEKGSLVFNAWERLSPGYDKMCEPFLLAASIQVMKDHHDISRVTLGTNKANARFNLVSDPEKPKEERLASADANTQYEVATREKLKLAETKLQALSKKQKTSTQSFPSESMDLWQLRQRQVDGSSYLSGV